MALGPGRPSSRFVGLATPRCQEIIHRAVRRRGQQFLGQGLGVIDDRIDCAYSKFVFI
jgi:hypothetical protein